MPATLTQRRMTADEFLALPDDGIERMLIDGICREPATEIREMTVRNLVHSQLTIVLGHFLEQWRRTQPKPRGAAVGGEAGFRLKPDPDGEEAVVGLDLAYVSHESVARRGTTTMVQGPPILAVEIVSPHNTDGELSDKVDLLLKCGCKVVWVVYPKSQTVIVHRPGVAVQALDAGDTLTAPELPGFSVPIPMLFE